MAKKIIKVQSFGEMNSYKWEQVLSTLREHQALIVADLEFDEIKYVNGERVSLQIKHGKKRKLVPGVVRFHSMAIGKPAVKFYPNKEFTLGKKELFDKQVG